LFISKSHYPPASLFHEAIATGIFQASGSAVKFAHIAFNIDFAPLAEYCEIQSIPRLAVMFDHVFGSKRNPAFREQFAKDEFDLAYAVKVCDGSRLIETA